MLKTQENLSAIQHTLVERCLGCVVSFVWDGHPLTGTITFVDYDVFCVQVKTEYGIKFVDPRKVKLVRRRTKRVPVRHHVRLDGYRYGSGWYGSAVADPEMANEWLEPADAAKSA